MNAFADSTLSRHAVAGPLTAPAAPQAEPDMRVLATVVCFEPDRQQLTELVERLKACPLDQIVLVDNSETEPGRAAVRAIADAYDAELVASSRNLGVAEAQNIALRMARVRGHSHALLLDQDSLLDCATIETLMAAYRKLVADGHRVAAVGPALFDPRSQTTLPFVRLGRLRMKKLPTAPGALVDCDLLISSGCLLSMAAVEAVGEMDREFFIDYVDFEWCTRAKAAGFKVFGVTDALMVHTIGDNAIHVLGRVIALHNPIRNYYAIRNALLFARKPQLSWRWRAHLVYRASAQFGMFGLLCPERMRRMGWMLRGAWDGLRGRGGRLGGDRGLGAASRDPGRPATVRAPVASLQAGRLSPMRESEPVASSIRARLR